MLRLSSVCIFVVCSSLSIAQNSVLDFNRPSVVVPRISASVDLAKPPTDEMWQKASWINNFVKEGESSLLNKQAKVGLMYDDKYLYIAGIIDVNRTPITQAEKGDVGLMFDDAIEVIIDPPGYRAKNGGPMVLLINPLGLRDDAIDYNFKINFGWENRAFIEDSKWMAIFAVPFSSIGYTPKEGDQWKFNAAWYLPDLRYCRPISWCPVTFNNVHNPSMEGSIRFGNSDQASSIDRIMLDGGIKLAGSGPQNGTMVYHVSDKSGKPVYTGAQKSEQGRFEANLKWPEPGNYLVNYAVLDSNQKMINADSKQIEVFAPISLKIRKYPVHRKAEAYITLNRMDTADSVPGKMKISWLQSGQMLGLKTFDLENKLPIEQIVDLGSLKPGNVTIKIQVEEKATIGIVSAPIPGSPSAKKKSILSCIEQFEQPAVPEWADNRIGEPNGSPISPWKPITVDNQKIKLWGRTYDFTGSLFPGEIISQDKQILSSPILLCIAQNGKQIDFTADKDECVRLEANGGRAIISKTLQGNGITIKGNVTVDYDGFIWFELDYSAQQDASIDHIYLDIPIKEDFAKLQTHWPGMIAEQVERCSLPVPNSGLKLPFVASIWLGSVDAGLQWYSESDQHLNPGDVDNVVEVIKKLDCSVIRIHIQDIPAILKGSRHLSFGLMATPVKPWPADFYNDKARNTSGLEWGMNRIPIEDAAVVSYVLPSGFDSKYGSMEFDIESQIDLLKYRQLSLSPNPLTGDMLICELQSENADSVKVIYSKQKGKIRVVGSKKNGETFLDFENAKELNWQPGQDHNINISWGDAIRLSVDNDITAQNIKGLGQEFNKGSILKFGSIKTAFYIKQLSVRAGDSKAQEIVKDEFHSRSIDQQWKSKAGTNCIISKAFAINPEHGLDLDNKKARTFLHHCRDMGVKYMLYFETWTNVENGGVSPWEDGLKELAEAVHALDMKMFLYFGFHLGELPEFKDMVDECKADIYEQPAIITWQIPQYPAYWVSYASPYQDYLVYHAARLKKKLGLDGLYLDGSSMPTPSNNRIIGCGYVTDCNESTSKMGYPVRRMPDGKFLKPTMPIRSHRNLVRRLRNLFPADQGIIIGHAQPLMATTSHVDTLIVGENLMSTSWDWKTPQTLIPVPTFQTVFYGRTWGIPQQCNLALLFAHLTKNNYPNWETGILGWCALNDNRMFNCFVEYKMPKATKMQFCEININAEFGVEKCKWYPYWETEKEIGCLNPDVKFSAWRRNDGALLLTVFNSSKADFNDIVSFPKGSRIMPRNGLKVYDAVQNSELGIFTDEFKISVPAWDYRIVQIGEKEVRLPYKCAYDYVKAGEPSYYKN